MKKILIAIVVVVTCVVGTLVFVWTQKSENEQNLPSQPSAQFPTAGPNEPVSTDPYPNEPVHSVGEDVLSLRLTNGARIEVKDFIQNGLTVKDVVNPGTYVLAGPLGYCLPDGSCPQGADVTGFRVSYDENYNLFSVVLEESLRVNRGKAESFVVETLGIPRRDLCDVPHWVGTTSYINPQYAGQNLGFSFCPGAVALP